MTSATGGGDLIDVLLDQHQQIKAALARVEASGDEAKEAAFAELRSLLHAHELGEQEVSTQRPAISPARATSRRPSGLRSRMPTRRRPS